MTRAMDYFDLAADYGGQLAGAFRKTRTRFCVVSFTSDWLFPTSESRAVVHALNAGGASVSFVEIETDKGHDAFLLDVPDLFATTRGFIDAAARTRGLDLAGPSARMSVPARHRRRIRSAARLDLLLVADMVEPDSRVLDLGCGDGALLTLLVGDARRGRAGARAVAEGASTIASPKACR